METTIKKRVKGQTMETLFDRTDLINIRFFRNLNLKNESDWNEDKTYLYEIKIRHNEDENPLKILNNAIKQSNDTTRKNTAA